MISNFDLEDLANELNIQLEVVPKDHLPTTPKYGNFIINLMDSGQSGSHWVLLIARKTQSFYFDSFGAPPPIEVMNYIKLIKTAHFGYNVSIIQDLKSSNCGFFCMSLLIYLKHNNNKNLYTDIQNYLDLYDDETMRNDGILRSIYYKYADKINNKSIKRLLKQK